ncbi:hypothetical protein [Jiella sp. M17.18]|uniref:hypothetical protein n=1 Tax=Jiella sp. M17.18 TaxID=3234247 RepID=UPI0034DEF72C
MHHRAIMLAGLALILASPALADGDRPAKDSGDWSVRRQAGETRYELRKGNSYFAVTCTNPRFGGGATFDIVLKGIDSTAHSETRVFVGGQEYDLRHGALGVGVTDCAACSKAFLALWQALRDPHVDRIELKRGETSVRLPARGGDTALGNCTSDRER